MSKPVSPSKLGDIIENEQGKFTCIREEGPRNEQGGFDAELWAKEGVDQTVTVWYRSLTGESFSSGPA